MNWFKKLFGSKESQKKQELNQLTYPSSTGYISYVPTGRTAETRYVDVSNYNNQNNADFLTSMMVAQETDSAALGVLMGGDVGGAIIGDMLNTNDSTPSYDSGSSNDSSFGSDSTSSFDSSSDSGGW
jgi:hypothetical protein